MSSHDSRPTALKGVNVTFAENAIKLFLCPCGFRRSLEGDHGDAGGAATAVVLLTIRLVLAVAKRTYESGAKEVGSVSRFLGGLGACGASYPDLWLTDKRANLPKYLLWRQANEHGYGRA